MRMPKPEYKDIPSLLKDAEECFQYLEENSVCYMFISMYDFLKALDSKYKITMIEKIKEQND